MAKLHKNLTDVLFKVDVYKKLDFVNIVHKLEQHCLAGNASLRFIEFQQGYIILTQIVINSVVITGAWIDESPWASLTAPPRSNQLVSLSPLSLTAACEKWPFLRGNRVFMWGKSAGMTNGAVSLHANAT